MPTDDPKTMVKNLGESLSNYVNYLAANIERLQTLIVDLQKRVAKLEKKSN